MRIVVVVLLVFISLNGYSQTITVKDHQSNEIVVGATVENRSTGKFQVSDGYGRVKLENYEHADTLYVSSVAHRRYVVYPEDLKYGKLIRLYRKVEELQGAEVMHYRGRDVRVADNPQTVAVLGASEIKNKNPQTTAHLLEGSGKVLVQRSQMGGGSPILRGFEASKVLLVVDGVRMNNAIYRSGHLQNAISVDNNILRQAEVIFGPNSVVYGSDAMGGVIHFRTKDPIFSESDKKQHVFGGVLSRLSSANQEKTFHVHLGIGGTRFSSLTSVSKSDFGDLRMGTQRDHGNANWGLVPFYASLEEGEVISLDNPDPEVQRGTAYSQVDFLQKFALKASEKVDLTANFQFSTSSDVPRFDKLNDVRDDKARWAEWSYGPQQRIMFSVHAMIRDTTRFFDDVSITGAIQRLDEDRIQRRLDNNERQTQQEDVVVYSVNSDFEKRLKRGFQLNYGVEATHNVVESTAKIFNIETREFSTGPTRYPNGGSTMSTAAAYAGVNKDLRENKILVNAGLRYSFASLSAAFVPNSFYELPFDEIDFSNGALSGSIGLIFRPDSSWQFNVSLGSGYRSPNVDDFGKVREKNGLVIVPNDFLQPEYAYSADLNIHKWFLDQRIQINATGFYTLLQNAIVPRDYALNGDDSLFVEGEMARIQTNVNAQSAVVWGYYLGGKVQITKNLNAQINYNFTYGQETEGDLPMAHIPPVFGSASATYNTGRFRASLGSLFNGSKVLERYGPGSTDNLIEGLETGTPGWWTLNTTSSYYIGDAIEVQFAVDNILDKHYKTFASAISAPGRNFIISLRATF